MKEELFIKSISGKWEKADLSAQSNIVLAYKNNLLGTIGKIQSSYSYTITLPKTSNNMRIFQLCTLPSVVVVNGIKVIGEPFQVRYRKEGIDILGDAVGFLDGVTKEAFEIGLCFGFLGAFSDWIEEEKTLNDLSAYSGQLAITTTYDNNLTDYPASENIDDLPAIFKPYYDIGFDPATVKPEIARLPAVRVPYLIEQIEETVNCKFSFPQNITERLKYLAVPLVSKKVFFSSEDFCDFSHARIVNSTLPPKVKWSERHPDETDIDGSYGAMERLSKELKQEGFGPFAGISFDTFSPNGIEGVFSTSLIELRASSIAGEGGSNNMLTLAAITPDKDITIVSGGFLGDIIVDLTTDWDFIDNTGYISLYKMAQLGDDSQFDIVEEIYRVGYTILNIDDYENARKYLRIDEGTKIIKLESGYSYGFVLKFCVFQIVIEGEKTVAKASKIQQSGAENNNPAKFSFQSPSGLSTNDAYLDQSLQAKDNLPDISQVDFIQSLCDMFGMFPIINPIPKKDDETGKRTVEFVSIDTLFKNKVSRYVYGKKFNDWTDRLITDPNDIEISFSKDGYYQRNYLRYAEDDTVTGNYDGYFDIPDKSLDKEGDLIELPFAASDGDKIMMFSEEKDSNNNITYSFEGFEPRIMSVIKRDDGKCGLTFSGLDFKSLLSKYYSRYIELVQDMYLITVTVELNALDLKNIDYSYPVYFKQFRRYFGIVDIQANSNDDNCEVTLLRLSAG
ncbi:MAG: hypothetical protein DBX65_04650 [Oscillospiraceae bacterium]|nr:MAG: hypothetical protein DBX65_04650 [Oscillospiraceae bacterium]